MKNRKWNSCLLINVDQSSVIRPSVKFLKLTKIDLFSTPVGKQPNTDMDFSPPEQPQLVDVYVLKSLLDEKLSGHMNSLKQDIQSIRQIANKDKQDNETMCKYIKLKYDSLKVENDMLTKKVVKLEFFKAATI